MSWIHDKLDELDYKKTGFAQILLFHRSKAPNNVCAQILEDWDKSGIS